MCALELNWDVYSSCQLVILFNECCCGSHVRFSSICKYDFELFRQRFLGDDAVSHIKTHDRGLSHRSHALVGLAPWAEAIDKFWEALKPTDFFKQHPVLSHPATLSQSCVDTVLLKRCAILFDRITYSIRTQIYDDVYLLSCMVTMLMHIADGHF